MEEVPMGSFFLIVGYLISVFGCIGSIVFTVLAVSGMIGLTKQDLLLGAWLGLGGVISFCYNAALCLVFAEVLLLRASRREQERRHREEAPPEPPETRVSSPLDVSRLPKYPGT
jgi:hypothetical protein